MKSGRRKFGGALICTILLATFAFVSVGYASAATIYVPSLGNETINKAVYNSNPGDIIIVREGIYNENINVEWDKPRLTIRSEDGPDSTIVQGVSYDHVFDIMADYVNISGFTVKGATDVLKCGICLRGGVPFRTSHCNISNNIVLNNNQGIHVASSSYNTLINNKVFLNPGNGISLLSSSNNRLSNNDGSNNGIGIRLYSSGNNTLISNNFSDGSYGILISSSNYNNIYSNSLSNNKVGIMFHYSSNGNTFTDNKLFDNGCGIDLYFGSNNTITNNIFKNDGIRIQGYEISHFNTHTIDGNVINGKPIYYYKNTNGIKVPEDASEVILANCANMVVKNINTSFGTVGIELAYTTNSIISNCISNSNTWDGFYLISSNNNTLTNNIASHCSGGFWLWGSSHNNISKNILVSNSNIGIELIGSSNSNLIATNIISNNGGYGVVMKGNNNTLLSNNNISYNSYFGIYIGAGAPSNKHLIYHNNFINNTNQANDGSSPSFWDNGYPSGGNYWSDYDGSDIFSGPFQNTQGSDGIGDIPYNISGYGGAKDHYPLMMPWIVEQLPVANFTVNVMSGYAPLTVLFTDTSTGDPTAWEWDVDGDGNVDYTTQDATHIYTEPGVYTVTLMVSNEYGGDTETKTDYITVSPSQLPDLTFDYGYGIHISPEDLVVGEPVYIDVLVKNTEPETTVTDDFNVTFYLGDPDTNGDGVIDDSATEIGIDLVEGPLPYGIATYTSTTWTPEDVGTFDVYAVIDPEIDTSDAKIGLVIESDESNNEAHTEVNVIKLLPVPYFNQGDAQWCWLNSIAMIHQYFGVKSHSWDYADYYSVSRDKALEPFWDNRNIINFIKSKNLHPDIDITNPNIHGYEGFFHSYIKTPIEDKKPVFLSYDAERNGKRFGHAIVIVSYSIRNGQKYVYMHDPSGAFFSDDDNMFIETPYQDLWDDISGYIDFVQTIIISSDNQIPTSHPVIYFNEDNEFLDCDISHSETPEGIESYLYLDKGIKFVTSRKAIQGFPEIDPGSQYLRWKDSDIISLNRLVASNPSSEPSIISVNVKLLEFDWFDEKWYTAFEDTIEDISIEPRTITEITESISDTMPLDIKFSKSGTIKLFFEATVNGEVVDEIGPININVVTPFDFLINAQCPVNLIIEDPDGLILSHQMNDIPSATYSEMDMNGDGDPDDLIIIPNRKTGKYQITVIPEPDAEPTDTYTLEIMAGDKYIVLAENVPISDIPDQPYVIRSTEEGIFIPVTVDFDPNTLNLQSEGKWVTTYIELPEGYDVSDIDVSTVMLNDQVYAEDHLTAIGDCDGDGILDLMVKFDRPAVQDILEVGEEVEITVAGELTDGTPFEGRDTIRVIEKGGKK